MKQYRGDLRNTWRIINELTSRKSKSTFVNEVILNNGNSIHDPLALSEAFNDHFSNIGPRLVNEIHVNDNCPSYVDYLSGTCDSRFELGKQPLYPQFSRFYLNYLNPKQQVWTKYRQDFYVIVLI